MEHAENLKTERLDKCVVEGVFEATTHAISMREEEREKETGIVVWLQCRGALIEKAENLRLQAAIHIT